MALYPGATWRNSPNHGGLLFKAIGVIEHVEAGTEAGTVVVFGRASYQASSHFGVAKDGSIDQFVDTINQAWAQAAGNSAYFSIETEGYPTEPLTDAQVESFAKLYAWLQLQTNAQFGFTLAEQPGQPGLGWHGMGGQAWGGHFGCPGDLRKAQRQRILDLAQPVPPVTTSSTVLSTSEELVTRIFMGNIRLDASGHGWVSVAVPFANFRNAFFLGSNPPTDGYWQVPNWGAQDRAGVTVIEIWNGAPNENVNLYIDHV